MRRAASFTPWSAVGFGIFLAGCLNIFGQTPCDISLISRDVETVGGISYLHLVAETDCGYTLRRSPVSVSGTNVSLEVFPQVAEISVCTIPPLPVRHNVSIVLGTLEPGRYLLTIRMGGVWMQRPFEVAPSPGAFCEALVTNGIFTFRIEAPTSICFVVESSLTLTNWTPVATNCAASRTSSFEANTLAKFYRARPVNAVPVGVPTCF